MYLLIKTFHIYTLIFLGQLLPCSTYRQTTLMQPMYKDYHFKK